MRLVSSDGIYDLPYKELNLMVVKDDEYKKIFNKMMPREEKPHGWLIVAFGGTTFSTVLGEYDTQGDAWAEFERLHRAFEIGTKLFWFK